MSERDTDRIRVLVVDDQDIIRDGLVTVLGLLPDIEVVGEAADGGVAVRLARATRPDVILMDLRMPGVDGIAATEHILAESPQTCVLVLTTYSDDESVLAALRAGARGYLTKDASRAEVAAALRSVSRGQTTFSADVGARIVESVTHPQAREEARDDSALALAARFPLLTSRESEVLELMVRGRTNSEIARELFVSVATVKTHINAIFSKLGVASRTEAFARVRQLDS